MILNIYKPKNWTSFDVIAKLRKILNTKKIGHAGTLDPLAEGVLIVLTGKDTKKQDLYMHTQKEYIADIGLGLTSDSYDLETPLFKSNVPLQVEDLSKYIGKFEQKVPPYSAVKVGGSRLYNLARHNIDTIKDLPTRQVEIFEIEKIKEYSKNFEGTLSENSFDNVKVIQVRIVCSSGFYVRSFAHDIGGVLINLVRTKVGDFTLNNSTTLEEIQKLVLDNKLSNPL